MLFVDGRYTLQAREQVDTSLFEIVHLVETPPDQWIEQNADEGRRASATIRGCTPSRARRSSPRPAPMPARRWSRSSPTRSTNCGTTALPRRSAPVTLHDIRFAGEAAETKLSTHPPRDRKAARPTRWWCPIRTRSPGPSTSAAPTSSHTPLPLSFAVIPREGRPSLFIDGRKLSNDVRHRLEELADVREPADFAARARRARQSRQDRAARPGTAADALARIVSGAGGKVTKGADPIALLKAVKNPVEIEGARAAHRRDGAAVARFLAWFDREAPSGKLTEIDAVEALESFRRETGLLKDVSFPTISGAGTGRRDRALSRHPQDQPRDRARRAVPDRFRRPVSGRHHRHHPHRHRRRADRGDARPLHPRAQGPHRDRDARCFRTAPPARSSIRSRAQSLWQAGIDFDHGTGHGVGSYLSVHEGPARISKLGTAALKRGMILSNEPGYYKAGAYGIRIENLVLVIEGPDGRGRREAAQCVRDADAGADRPPARRSATCSPPRRSRGSTAITPACATTLSPLVDADDRDLARRRDARALVEWI